MLAVFCTISVVATLAIADGPADCFIQQSVILPGTNGKQDAWRNVGKCSCKDARNPAEGNLQRLGSYTPQCDDSGKFSLTQSWGSTGRSWCADPATGHQISQSQSPGAPGQNCAMIAANAKSNGMQASIVAVPAGSNSASVGECLKLVETVLPGVSRPQFGWRNSRICSCKDARNLLSSNTGEGSYIPQCDSTGKYNLKQHWGSTGTSWCVDPTTGHQISQTAGPGDPGLNCGLISANANSQAASAPDCFDQQLVSMPGVNEKQNVWKNVGGCACKDAQNRVRGNFERVGDYAPQCDNSGKFSTEQFWGSTGSAWCADPITGHQITQAVGPGQLLVGC